MGTLRLLLAIGVLLQHVRGCHYAMTGGATSVQTFFMISGFLIAMILDVKYNRPDQRWLFYSNRALRIFSTYWVVLAGTVILQAGAHFATHASVFDLWRANDAKLGAPGMWYLGLSNLLLVGQDLALFMKIGGHGLQWTESFWNSSPIIPSLMLIPPAWSLSLELCFYAIAPWILTRRTRWIVALLGASVAIRAGLWWAGLREDPWSYRFFPNEISLFLAGALAYRLFYRHHEATTPTLKSRIFQAGVFPAVVLYPLYDTSQGLFFSTTKIVYLVYVAIALPFLFRSTSKIAWDRKLGELSYPLYLCHFNVVQVLDHFSSRLNVYTRVVLAIGLSCGAAYLCVVLLERPLDRFRQRRVKRSASQAIREERSSAAPELETEPATVFSEPTGGNLLAKQATGNESA